MKPSILPHLFLLCVAVSLFGLWPVHAQSWQSGIKATGSDQSEAMYEDADIAVDGAGNMVIAGYFENTLSFGSFNIQADGDSYPDLFICRITANQEVLWLKQVEAGFNYGDNVALSLDDDNNIYLTGNQDGKIFAAKYNSAGMLLWNKTFGSDAWGYGTAVKTDIFDNVYVSGGDGWTFFLAKLSHAGDILWVKDIWVNFSAGCLISDLAVDVSGNVYFAGKFEIDLPLDHITLNYTSSWGPNVFWGKMNSQGKFLWAKSASGRSTEKVNLELTFDNHLILSGGVGGSSVTFGGKTVTRSNCCDGASGYIVKSDTTGTVLWAKQSTYNYNGSMPVDMQVDRAGNIYMTGIYFTCYGSFCTENDFYVEKYDPAGTPLWRTDYASGETEYSKGIDIDNNGSLYLLGINSSPTFIDNTTWSPVRTFGIGLFDTGSSTYKKTPRPTTNRQTWVCQTGDPIALSASGEQLKWYNSALLTIKLADGAMYTPALAHSDTIYVTQTIDGMESWPAPAIVTFADIPDGDLVAVADTIFAPEGNNITYQWFHGGAPIVNGTNQYILVTAGEYENYSVALSQGTCEKTLDHIITSADPEVVSDADVYPNPASNFVTIANTRAISSVRVLDIRGNELARSTFPPGSELSVDLRYHNAGLIIIELIGNGIRKYFKVLKR